MIALDTERAHGLCWQGNLFDSVGVGAGNVSGQPAFDRTFRELRRHWLDETSWIDHAPNWLGGADQVCADLLHLLPWRQRKVTMWDRVLPEPRLTHWWDGSDGTSEPLGVLGDVRWALGEHYHRPFDTIGFNLYRDGRDSVAWHGDRERFAHEDPVVVIVSTGAPRPFLVRPRGGGRSRRFMIGHGDLLVMGGACQHDWEHCVPKIAKAAGPRVSIMFRHHLAAVRTLSAKAPALCLHTQPFTPATSSCRSDAASSWIASTCPSRPAGG